MSRRGNKYMIHPASAGGDVVDVVPGVETTVFDGVQDLPAVVEKDDEQVFLDELGARSKQMFLDTAKTEAKSSVKPEAERVEHEGEGPEQPKSSRPNSADEPDDDELEHLFLNDSDDEAEAAEAAALPPKPKPPPPTEPVEAPPLSVCQRAYRAATATRRRQWLSTSLLALALAAAYAASIVAHIGAVYEKKHVDTTSVLRDRFGMEPTTSGGRSVSNLQGALLANPILSGRAVLEGSLLLRLPLDVAAIYAEPTLAPAGHSAPYVVVSGSSYGSYGGATYYYGSFGSSSYHGNGSYWSSGAAPALAPATASPTSSPTPAPPTAAPPPPPPPSRADNASVRLVRGGALASLAEVHTQVSSAVHVAGALVADGPLEVRSRGLRVTGDCTLGAAAGGDTVAVHGRLQVLREIDLTRASIVASQPQLVSEEGRGLGGAGSRQRGSALLATCCRGARYCKRLRLVTATSWPSAVLTDLVCPCAPACDLVSGPSIVAHRRP
jgi:hypothetical protein